MRTKKSGGRQNIAASQPAFPDIPDVIIGNFSTPAVGTALALMERMKKTQRMIRILRAQWTVMKKK